MKIAIFQNFLDTIGGAEVVGLTMAREFGADIYTTNVDPERIRNMGFGDVVPRVFSIGKVPANAPLRQQAVLWRFRRLNLAEKYDFFIINGDWAVSAAVNNKPNLWYVNATIREIWDLHRYVRKNSMPAYQRPIFDVWAAYNRHLNKKHVAHVDAIASNSAFTKERVKRYLGRESELVYPPTDTAQFRHGKSGAYWLSVNRIIMYKRIDMQMRAFAKLPEEKLIVIGPYERSKTSLAYVDLIRRLKPPNVTLVEHADSRAELAGYYAGCKGFITTCHQEDFGMTAVEAMASGKPVVAPNAGGYRETIADGQTGILVNDMDETGLAEAVKKLGEELKSPEREEYYRKNCRTRARQFDTSVFMGRIRNMIDHAAKS